LREFKRKEILDAIARRYAPKPTARRNLDVHVKSFGNKRAPGAAPLFDTDDVPDLDIVPTENDEALALALQQEELGSDEEEADPDLARALALSRKEAERAKAGSPVPVDEQDDDVEEEMEEIEVTPSERTRSETIEVHDGGETEESMDELEEVSLVPSGRSTPVAFSAVNTPIEVSDDEVEEIPLPSGRPTRGTTPSSSFMERTRPAGIDQVSSPAAIRTTNEGNAHRQPSSAIISTSSKKPSAGGISNDHSTPPPLTAAIPSRTAPTRIPSRQHSFPRAPVRPSPLARSPSIEIVEPSSDAAMEEVPIAGPSTPPRPIFDAHLPDFHPETPPSRKATGESGMNMPEPLRSPHRRSAADLLAFVNMDEDDDALSDLRRSRSASAPQIADEEEEEDAEDEPQAGDDSRSIEWSRSPSPRNKRPALHPAESGESIPLEVDEEDVDMNREDMNAEEDDYARFMAQIKNRDLNEVRGEIDDEIRILNNQNKVAMRDSDEITQSMVSQIQTLLRHFGIPYITAPMEAEAQCAKLAELGLVDGIITDDSDVFLFGGLQCFKNIFNDSKYAECFLLADINRELSLTRERLISLAYLLGSDYTIGLPGVGPVVALELLANFPGETGVEDFKAWWTKVQRGQDGEDETDTKWKKSFVSAICLILLDGLWEFG
jgi:DNA excision repair protein ERCC-5